jgi:hypothetical protein
MLYSVDPVQRQGSNPKRRVLSEVDPLPWVVETRLSHENQSMQ